MEVVKEFVNGLLHRKELTVVENYDSNPGIEKMKADVASHLKVPVETISIKHLTSHYGSSEFKADLFVYDTQEDMKAVETRNKKKKAKK